MNCISSISSSSCSSSLPLPAESWCRLLHPSASESLVLGSSLPRRTSRLYLRTSWEGDVVGYANIFLSHIMKLKPPPTFLKTLWQHVLVCGAYGTRTCPGRGYRQPASTEPWPDLWIGRLCSTLWDAFCSGKHIIIIIITTTLLLKQLHLSSLG